MTRRSPGVGVAAFLIVAFAGTVAFAQAPERSGMADSHFRGGEVALDSPASGTAVSGQVQIAGWTIDTSPEYTGLEVTGIDAVDIYLDGPAGKGTLLGRASYGFDRADVAAAFGQARYRMSGFSLPWNTAEVTPGTHTLFVYIHSVGHTWTLKEFLVRIADPNGPSAPILTLTDFGPGRGTLRAKWIDSPSHKVPSTPEWYSIDGTRSWTYEPGAKVTVTATPDAGSVFGGFIGGGCGLSPSCDIEMSAAFSTMVAGAFELAGGPASPGFETKNFAIKTDVVSNAAVSGVLSVTGFALYLGCGATCPSGPGVDAVDLYLDGAAGQGTFIGRSTLGINRPDVAPTFLHSRFLASGFRFTVDTSALSAGSHVLYVYAHSIVTGAWGVIRVPLPVRTPSLQVRRAGLGSGRVTSVPEGIDTGNRMHSVTWAPGTMVTLTAKADAGAVFAGWSGGGCQGMLTCTVTMRAESRLVDVTAEFASGDVSLSGGMTIDVDVDDDVALSGRFTLTGMAFALDPRVVFDAVDLYVDGPAGQGGFLGRATYGVQRSDRGTFERTGFEIAVDLTLTPGYHDLIVYAHRVADPVRVGTWVSRTFRILVAGPDVQRVWAIHVRVEGDGRGRVTSAPAGIDARGGHNSAPIIEGAEVRLTATPDPGSQFAGFGGACRRRDDPTFLDKSSCDVVTDGTTQEITAIFNVESLRPGVALDLPGREPIEVDRTDFVGWAIHIDADDPTGPGVDATHLYLNGEAGKGGTFLGASTYGLARPDLAQAFGVKYGMAGYRLSADLSAVRAACMKPLCGHTVNVYVHSKKNGWTFTSFPITVTGGNGSTMVTANVAGTGTGRVEGRDDGRASTLEIDTTSTQSVSYPRTIANVTLRARPLAGSMFTGWTDCDVWSADQCTMVLNSAAKSVTATFTLDTQPLAVTVTGTGAGRVQDTFGNVYSSGTRTVSFATNASVGLGVTPDTGSTFAGWSGACIGTGAVWPVVSCGVSMTGPRSVAATFTLSSATTKQLSVTVIGPGSVASNPAGISTPGTNSATYKTGTVVTLTPTPAASFAGWSGACDGKGDCAVTLDSDRSVTATFTAVSPTTHTLTVSVTGTGTGMVTSTPSGINAPSTPSASFTAGLPVTLTASPGPTSKFDGWSGAGCSGLGACFVTMDAAKSVTATFTAAPATTQTLTVTLTGTGTGPVSGTTVTSSPAGINTSTSQSASFASGTVVTLTANPGQGVKFDGWSNPPCTPTGPTTCNVTMDGARNVIATFSK